MNLTRIFRTASILGLLLNAGCLSSEGRTFLSADHPANPQAQEVVFTSPPNLLAQPVSPAQATPPVESEGQIYTCPMHPEVQAHAPGTCPKCGMTLELVVPAAKHEHDHEQEMPH